MAVGLSREKTPSFKGVNEQQGGGKSRQLLAREKAAETQEKTGQADEGTKNDFPSNGAALPICSITKWQG